MSILPVRTASAGTSDVTAMVPGQSLTETLTQVWRSHIEAHLDRCGRVAGPLREWVCRLGHPLWNDNSR